MKIKTFKSILLKTFPFLLFFLFTYLIGYSQSSKTKHYNLLHLHKKGKLVYFNKSAIPISADGKEGISREGITWLKDVLFSTGTIEIDLRGKDIFQKSFLGIAFHSVDTITYDAIYFRPFNFKAEDPIRRIHAVQYISHPKHPWYVLRENFPGKYEKAVTPAPQPEEWFHATIVINESTIKVFVNQSKEPSLIVEKLNDRTNGLIGLWANGSEGDFANLSITNH